MIFNMQTNLLIVARVYVVVEKCQSISAGVLSIDGQHIHFLSKHLPITFERS